ncbi:MAG: hypothetical protein ACI9GK_000667 [Devosia sp.]|jgi:hypothetical protein|tara:strand:- start:4120 stop:4230 length:111 start_codon:yes stop_codon:yes gene_type:complete
MMGSGVRVTYAAPSLLTIWLTRVPLLMVQPQVLLVE